MKAAGVACGFLFCTRAGANYVRGVRAAGAHTDFLPKAKSRNRAASPPDYLHKTEYQKQFIKGNKLKNQP